MITKIKDWWKLRGIKKELRKRLHEASPEKYQSKWKWQEIAKHPLVVAVVAAIIGGVAGALASKF